MRIDSKTRGVLAHTFRTPQYRAFISEFDTRDPVLLDGQYLFNQWIRPTRFALGTLDVAAPTILRLYGATGFATPEERAGIVLRVYGKNASGVGVVEDVDFTTSATKTTSVSFASLRGVQCQVTGGATGEGLRWTAAGWTAQEPFIGGYWFFRTPMSTTEPAFQYGWRGVVAVLYECNYLVVGGIEGDCLVETRGFPNLYCLEYQKMTGSTVDATWSAPLQTHKVLDAFRCSKYGTGGLALVLGDIVGLPRQWGHNSKILSLAWGTSQVRAGGDWEEGVNQSPPAPVQVRFGLFHDRGIKASILQEVPSTTFTVYYRS